MVLTVKKAFPLEEKQICFRHFFLRFHISLKVPSGQIGSAWEWYHSIGLEKDINCYFWIFNFDFEYLIRVKVLSRSWKNESNFLLVRITVCIESCLPIGWSTYIWRKNPPNCCSSLVWIAGCWNSLLTSRNPKKLMSLPHFWSTVRRKRSRFEHMQIMIQTSRRWDSFLHEAASFCGQDRGETLVREDEALMLQGWST